MRALILCLLLAASPALAVQPDEVLPDPTLEARARQISHDLRCPVCQGEAIDDSNAPISRDLRLLVRERLVAGDSDEEVVDFIVARYGEFVLLRPPFTMSTLLLWGTPFAVLAIAAGFMLLRRRRAEVAPETPLSDDEKRALERAMQ